MTAAAISGDFATYRHVQGRKVLQLVIEVPAEMASAVFAALGTPGSGTGIPVALARLTAAPETVAKHDVGNADTISKERRPFSELPYSQQAALRCQEPDFERFLVDADYLLLLDEVEDRVPNAVRNLCGVESRKDIVKGQPSGAKWAVLDAEYWAWQRGGR